MSHAIILCVLAGLAFTVCTAHAADSAHATSGERILFTGRLDPDCHSDTVLGTRTADGIGYLPTRIIWGAPRAGHPGTDTACGTSARVRRTQTVFTYDDWEIAGGSVAFQRLNDDDMTDIILHIRGVPERRSGGMQDGERRDSLRSVVIFGQRLPDSLAVLPVSSIPRFQARPFFAMELSVGAELTQPATRDLSGAISYLLEPVDLLIRDRDSVMPSPEAPSPEVPSPEAPSPEVPIAGVDAKQGITARVYPNPADNTITIEAAGLAAGTYELQIVAADGEVALQQVVMPGDAGRLARTLDVARLPNGYHFVRMENSAGKIVGSWGIVIAR